MKWLLVSTNPSPHLPRTRHPHGAGWNVGDVFARIGTEQAIRAVDPAAEFEVLNMDSAESILTPRPFDRAVFAGRPMFWQGCESHPLWSELLNGWLCEDPRKVLALSVGDCFPIDENRDLEYQIEKARRRVWRLTIRSKLEALAEFLPCPATWVLLDRKEEPEIDLCNLMRGGGHYPGFSPKRAEKWEEMLPHAAKHAIEQDRTFVAHTIDERTLALSLGWKPERVFLASNVTSYLAIYARAKSYFGNRVHGGLVLASRPVKAIVAGFDSRIFSVISAGHSIMIPGSATIYSETSGADPVKRAERVEEIRAARGRAIEILRAFARN